MRGRTRGSISVGHRLRCLAGVEVLEDPARGAGRVQAAGDDLVEQAGEVVVLAERLLQAPAQAERAEREDLAAQVAPPALAQGALGLDERAVLVELLDQLLDALAPRGL